MMAELRFKIKRNGLFMIEDFSKIKKTDTLLCFFNGCQKRATVTGEVEILSDDKQKIFKKPVFFCKFHSNKLDKDMKKTRGKAH